MTSKKEHSSFTSKAHLDVNTTESCGNTLADKSTQKAAWMKTSQVVTDITVLTQTDVHWHRHPRHQRDVNQVLT